MRTTSSTIHSPFIEDSLFKDKDVQATRAILKEQEEKPDHVDYEITIYNGTFCIIFIFFEHISFMVW